MRICTIFIAALGLAVSSCGGSEADNSKSSVTQATEAINSAEEAQQEENSINEAAEKATALIEAESNSEIKSMNRKESEAAQSDAKTQ